MKKYFIFVLLIVLFVFSYLYSKRIDSIQMYSNFEMKYLNMSEDNFTLSLYSNKDKTKYSSPNLINCELYLNDNLYKLSLNKCETKEKDSLYKIDYNFNMIDVLEGEYSAIFKINTNSETLTFNLGALYFKKTTTDYLEYTIDYNLQNNVEKYHVIFSKDKALESLFVNGETPTYNIVEDNILETKEIIIYPYNNLFLESVLVTINACDYILENSKKTSSYLIEAMYEDN